MNTLFSEDIAKEMSKRMKDYRIAYPLTQQELADKSGVSLRTIQSLEGGKSVQMSVFIKLMIALGLGANFDALIPDMENRPSTRFSKANGTERKRVRKKTQPNKRAFKWGDEQ